MSRTVRKRFCKEKKPWQPAPRRRHRDSGSVTSWRWTQSPIGSTHHRRFDGVGDSYALVGGQAVALWVTTKDPAAVRTTKDVDILLDRDDLPRAKAAALKVGHLDYFEVLDVGMFLERADPNPRHGVHLLWAGQKVKAEYPLPSPAVGERQELEPGKFVVSCPLVLMKLMANRDQDRVHLRDMIDVGLVDRSCWRACRRSWRRRGWMHCCRKRGADLAIRYPQVRHYSRRFLIVAKHIFVTGGVVSSLGKGLTCASIGMLLEQRGLASACKSSIPTSTSIPAP